MINVINSTLCGPSIEEKKILESRFKKKITYKKVLAQRHISRQNNYKKGKKKRLKMQKPTMLN